MAILDALRDGAVPPSPWNREMLDERQPELAALCRRHGVVAAYVFGSLARGRDRARTHARSDLDIALLFPGAWTPEQRHRATTMFHAELARLFGRPDIDVVAANDAPLALQYRITRERDIVWGRDARERVLFDWSTWRDYRDMEHFRRIGREGLLRRVREGRFGVRSTRRSPTAP